MKKIDLGKLGYIKQKEVAVKDWYTLPFLDFCIKYKYGKNGLTKTKKLIEKFEKEIKK